MMYGSANITGTAASITTLRTQTTKALSTSSHAYACGSCARGGVRPSGVISAGNPACSFESGVTSCDGSFVITETECSGVKNTNQSITLPGNQPPKTTLLRGALPAAAR